MTILSTTAIGRLAERHVRLIGQPVPVDQLIDHLEREAGVDRERAAHGLGVAVVMGRLERTAFGDRDALDVVPLATTRSAA